MMSVSYLLLPHYVWNYPAVPYQNDRFGQALLDGSQNLRKRDRTRAVIQNAGCALLDRSSLTALTISGICHEADIAHGTFYIYFPDRQAFVAELLLQFVDYVQDKMHAASGPGATDPARQTMSAYYTLFEHNPGLMKCLVNHMEDFPASREAFQSLNRKWATTVVTSMERKLNRSGRAGELSRDELMRRAYALGGMVDQYLSALILNQDCTLASVSMDREAVIDTLTHIWRRGMIE